MDLLILTRMPIRPTKRGLMIDLVYEPIRDPVVIKIESGDIDLLPNPAASAARRQGILEVVAGAMLA